MNPEKINKMDEEVKKWSRKDPQAIKKAMVYPGRCQLIHQNIISNYEEDATNDVYDKVDINDVYDSDTLEALERGGMVKDYNSNSTNLDSEDEEDPRTPASVSSQVPRLIALET